MSQSNSFSKVVARQKLLPSFHKCRSAASFWFCSDIDKFILAGFPLHNAVMLAGPKGYICILGLKNKKLQSVSEYVCQR